MVGTAHGQIQKAPVLDIAPLRRIKKATNIALVLHGGSGVPDDQIKAAIGAGVRKMNFSTDLCYTFLDACRERDKSVVGIDLFMTEPIARCRASPDRKSKFSGRREEYEKSSGVRSVRNGYAHQLRSVSRRRYETKS